MSRTTVLVVLCVQALLLFTDAGRILGVFPIPSISHQVVFRALTKELAKRGHEMVVITPNPTLPQYLLPTNVTEIDTGQTYDVMMDLLAEAQLQSMIKRGVVLDVDAMLSDESAKGMLKLISYQLELPQVKALLDDKTQKFDLVFIEAIANYHMIVTHFFKAPVIMVSSFFGFPEHYDIMGAVAFHPLYYPNLYRHKFRNLTFWEKIQECFLEWKIIRLSKKAEEREAAMLRERYGPDTPTIAEMKRNVQMLFVNAHPMFGNNRPVPPSVVYLGSLHLQPVKELPEDLKEFMENSTRGVIYVSLGTNVRPSMMEKSLLNAFLDAFEALPYDILWKYDDDNLTRIPKNVMIKKWFPQRDLLTHPNLKAFVMQGGMQSTDEAIDACTPLVGIPILGDQWYNVDKYVELGIGVKVDALTMTSEDLVNAVHKVINDKSYRENLKSLRFLMNDQQQTPLERAVWWTEHIMRHGGGSHLQAPAAFTTWPQYMMIEVVATIVAGFTLILLLVLFVLYKIAKYIKKRFFKPKQN